MELTNNDYFENTNGVKIPFFSTNSYRTFIKESGQLEFFIIFILLAEHPEKNDFKQHLVEMFRKDDNNKVMKNFISHMESESSNKIFEVGTYEEYFGQMAFTRLTDNALCYFKDVLSEVVKIRPEILKSNESTTYEYILEFETMEDLILDLTEKKIKQLFYGSIEQIKKYFNTKLKIKLFEDINNENDFNQIIKERNLIVHNRGVITTELANEFEMYQNSVGKKLFYTFEQLSIINKIISNIIVEIDLKLAKKYNLQTIEIT